MYKRFPKMCNFTTLMGAQAPPYGSSIPTDPQLTQTLTKIIRTFENSV